MMAFRNTQQFSIQNKVTYMHFGSVNKHAFAGVTPLPNQCSMKTTSFAQSLQNPTLAPSNTHFLLCLCFSLHTQRQPC